MKSATDLVMAAKAHTREIPLDQAEAAIAAADVLIDVREPDEHAAGHLHGALHIPRGLLEFKLSATPALERRDQTGEPTRHPEEGPPHGHNGQGSHAPRASPSGERIAHHGSDLEARK